MKKTLQRKDLELIGERLGQLRRASALTMLELAVQSKIPEYTIRHVERGDYRMMAGYIRTAAGLGVPLRLVLVAGEPRWGRFLENVRSLQRAGWGEFGE